MEDIKDFNAVIKDAQSKDKLFPRYLLLGNGFSIGCHGSFKFGKIRETLKNQGYQDLFDEFKDEDPEQILRALENAEHVLKALRGCPSVEIVIHDERQKFKNAFITAIAEQHPERQSGIGDEKFTACRRFLSHFLGQGNQGRAVYTFNYDLLLFWAIMWAYNQDKIAASDGFNTVDGVLKWTGKPHDERRDVYYLHGALHFYRSEENVLKKHKWESENSILCKVGDALGKGEYPLFIAGGTHHQKDHDIQQVPYLKTAHDRFKEHTDKNEGCLFLYGVSLSENDRHIWDHIIDGKIPQLYVGLYGDDRAEVWAFSEYMKHMRKEKSEDFPLEVDYFCTKSANVWDTPSGEGAVSANLPPDLPPS